MVQHRTGTRGGNAPLLHGTLTEGIDGGFAVRSAARPRHSCLDGAGAACGVRAIQAISDERIASSTDISMGVTQLKGAIGTTKEFLESADKKLYNSKQTGRNKVTT